MDKQSQDAGDPMTAYEREVQEQREHEGPEGRGPTEFRVAEGILVSKRAADYLARPPEAVLTRKQVRKALQLANDTENRVPGDLTVAQLRVLMSQPPQWLVRHHRALVEKGVPQVRHAVALPGQRAVAARQAEQADRPDLMPLFTAPDFERGVEEE
ncbi:hypothetical protein [Streptomyces gobiensis]|uniref:hypothetical protein n=1 Tax=Streptomyces gobiensis TaxID=2875706 RepID=UPI001E63DE64|nr:hypothetical protein [Streptomyces gobiensis]UGY91191.1 hypothetical protein test1122_05305 [Streptomyces gobiensis]